MDVARQILYWSSGSDNDLDTALLLISNRKFIHGLFFCHLAVEKMLKALVTGKTRDIPPKSHNLNYLSEIAGIKLADNQYVFMAILMKYQLEGRYPEYYPAIPDQETALDYLRNTKLLLECLRQML
jgi:HEPN domain-containing protein